MQRVLWALKEQRKLGFECKIGCFTRGAIL
jgi:hypothetical protein